LKAAVYKRYGNADVVSIQEIEKPVPAQNEVLIKILCSTVNRTDSGFRSAEYFISRFWSGLFKPKFQVLGCEFAGIIEAVGNEVTQFKVGDQVFGYNDKTFGGHAEYMVMNEDETLAIIPSHFSFEQAAALTEGAHYALCDIRAAKVKQGQEVLVYGATGAIGSAAVQILKHMGAIVTAVCNTKNTALVKSIGADRVINYEEEDFTTLGLTFDFIFDAVGKSSYRICKPLLNQHGIYISTELGERGVNILHAILSNFSSGKKLLFPIPTINIEDITYLKSLAESGNLKPLIDRTYPLDEIRDAYKYVETGQKTGNVILMISEH